MRGGASQQVPAEGPRIVAVVADFSAAHAYDLNSLLTQGSAFQRSIAGVFVDNSTNGAEVSIFINVVNQTIKVPADSQAYLTLFVPKNATLTMSDPSGASTAKVAFMFTNFPIASAVWSVSGGGGGGNLIELEAGGHITLESGGGRIALQ